MQAWIIGIMDKFGYLGIILLITLENLFPPIPSEVILTFGGFMTTYTMMQPILVILFATVGSVVGAFILYGVGTVLSKERLEKILDGKLGRILHFKKDDVEKSIQWFNRKGKITVLFCRCIPIVRSLISIPAGMAKMDSKLFLLYTTIGSLVWNTVLVYLGVVAGASWEKIVQYMDTYSTITIVVLGIIFLVAVFLFFKYRIKHKENK